MQSLASTVSTEFEQAWQEGENMTLEKALALAMEESV